MGTLSLLIFEIRSLWLKYGLLLLIVPVAFVGPYLLVSPPPYREGWVEGLEQDLSFYIGFLQIFVMPIIFVYVCAYEVDPERMALFLTRPVRKWQLLLARFSVLFILFSVSTAIANYLFFYAWISIYQAYYPALGWSDVVFPANTMLLMLLTLYIIGCAYSTLSVMISPVEMRKASPIVAAVVYIFVNLVYVFQSHNSFSAINLIAPLYYSDRVYAWMLSRLTGTPQEPLGPIGDPFTAVFVILVYFAALLLVSILAFERRDVI
ncbi:MAG: ABC transporter permease subunit [Candidatus Bathyarchaeota archaeon]|nr:ABC transporter permease subunit [Candidatus Bathyarchaeota archaeon]